MGEYFTWVNPKRREHIDIEGNVFDDAGFFVLPAVPDHGRRLHARWQPVARQSRPVHGRLLAV